MDLHHYSVFFSKWPNLDPHLKEQMEKSETPQDRCEKKNGFRSTLPQLRYLLLSKEMEWTKFVRPRNLSNGTQRLTIGLDLDPFMMAMAEYRVRDVKDATRANPRAERASGEVYVQHPSPTTCCRRALLLGELSCGCLCVFLSSPIDNRNKCSFE